MEVYASQTRDINTIPIAGHEVKTAKQEAAKQAKG
jgi:hypothetical protein